MDLAKMMVANVWMDRAKFEEAEMKFHAHNAGPAPASQVAAAGDAQPAVEQVCMLFKILNLSNETTITSVT